MLSLPDTTRLAPLERFALACLVDASNTLPAEGDAAALAVRLVIDESPMSPAEVEAPLRARGVCAVPFTDGEVRLPVAWLRLVGELLASASDGAGAPKDRHGRPLSASNRLVIAEAERSPVFSQLAEGLRQAVWSAAGECDHPPSQIAAEMAFYRLGFMLEPRIDFAAVTA